MNGKTVLIETDTANTINPNIIGRRVPILMGVHPGKCIGLAKIESISSNGITAKLDFDSQTAKLLRSDWPKGFVSIAEDNFLPILLKRLISGNEYEIVSISFIPGATKENS